MVHPDALALILLSVFHVAFFRRGYLGHPNRYATGEWLEQSFPSWAVLGRALRRGQWPPRDVYYSDYKALPFLSTGYPPHVLSAWLGTWLSTTQAWALFWGTMVSHYWLASGSVYILARSMDTAPLAAGFASVTLSYGAWALKLTCSLIYTLAWVPSYLLAAQAHMGAIMAISGALMLLGGYWPLALPALVLGGGLWLCS